MNVTANAAPTALVPVPWAAVYAAAGALADRHVGARERLSGVYGVPRGGCTVAAIVGMLLGLPVVDEPGAGVLVVDDLVDSGRTLGAFAGRVGDVDALFRKPCAPEGLADGAVLAQGWLVFPWERGVEEPAEDAVVRLLQSIGENPERDGLRDTPKRVVRALRELTRGHGEDPAQVLGTVFEEAYDEVVLLRGIPFASMCEHHLLPFTGTAAVGYIPNGSQVVGLSKLARLVDLLAARLQLQERLTKQIAGTLDTVLAPRAVGVVVEAAHSCMGCRGIRKPGATMVTSAMHGLFRDDARARAEFMALVRGG